MRISNIGALAVLSLIVSGCSTEQALSTSGRGLAVGVAGAGGALGGAAIGTAISPGNPIATVGGAAIGGAAGAGLANVLLGPDKVAIREAEEAAYQQGSSDEMKRLYWARQNYQRQTDEQYGRRAYYSFPAPTEYAADGTKLVPHEITVPVIE